MKRFLSVVAAVAVAVLGGVLVVGAAPQAQDESKSEKLIKSLTERIDKLEKRVAELEKKVAEKNVGGRFEERLKGLFEKFDGGGEGLKKMLEEFRGSMPGMPDFESMPDMLEGLDMEQLLDQLKGQFEGQLPGFFDGLDLDSLFEQFKDKLEKKSEPGKKSAPKRRSI